MLNETQIRKIMKEYPFCNPHPYSESVIKRLEEMMGSDYEDKLYNLVMIEKSLIHMDLENGDRCIITPMNFVGKKLLFVERILGVGLTITTKDMNTKEVIGESNRIEDDLFYPFIYPNDKPLNISVNHKKRNKYIEDNSELPTEIKSSIMMEVN